MFSNDDSALLACQQVRGPRELLVLPGHSQYGVYADGVREQVRAENIRGSIVT